MAFQVTTQLIGEYLKQFGFQKFDLVDEQDESVGFVATGWRGDEGSYGAFIDPCAESGLVHFLVPHALEVPGDADPERMGELYRYLLHLNTQMAVGTAGLDSKTNQLSLRIGLPVRDGQLSFEQFQFCMRGLIHLTEEMAVNAKKILAGESIFREDLGEVKAAGAPELSPEMMKEFLDWLSRQKKEGKE